MNKSDEYQEESKSKIYFDRHFNLTAKKILPGEFFATQEDMLIVTTLGSCVSACIWDAGRGIGGMNHFMLPERMHDQAGWGSSSARYGAYAMEMLINKLQKMGARRSFLEAKLFGGGAVLRQMTNNIGERNAQFARDYLLTEGIPVVSSDLGDIYPRKVYFFAKTGRAMIKKIQDTQSNTIVTREKQYSARLLDVEESGGDVELF